MKLEFPIKTTSFATLTALIISKRLSQRIPPSARVVPD